MRHHAVSLALLCCALAACNVAPPPEPAIETVDEAMDANAAPVPGDPQRATELRDAIQRPIDRANHANDPNVAADAAREQALKDAGG